MNRANRPRLSRISGSSYASKLLGRAGDGSTLTLDFTTGQLDPRLTFTRASTATFINASGNVATASNNVARFDYDPTTLAPRGLLIEATATNLLQQSAAVRTSPWSTANLTTAGASITAPDGTADGVELVWTNTTAIGLGYTFQEVAASASIAYTMSVYLKPKGVNVNTGLYIQARAGTTSLGYMTVSFVHTSGTIGSVAAGPFTSTSATSTPVGNGWYRVTVTGTSPATTTNIRFFIVNANVGNGTDGVYAWGAQAEAASGASSYIPTVASQVTRLADNCVMTGTNFSSWYNQGEGTFLMHCQLNRVGASHLLNVNVNNAAPRLMITESSSQFNAASENPSGTNFNLALGSSSTSAAKIIAAFKSLDTAGTRNGGTVQTSATLTIPTTVNLMRIGSAEGGYQYMVGTVSLLKYWPTRLSNAELQTLTT